MRARYGPPRVGLDRVENVGTQTTRFARDGLGDTRRHESLGEDRRGAGLAGEVGELPEAIGVRLLLGVDARDRLLGEVVTASEVAEGLVRGDNRASRARGQPAAVLAVERRELTSVARGARLVHRPMLGIGGDHPPLHERDERVS